MGIPEFKCDRPSCSLNDSIKVLVPSDGTCTVKVRGEIVTTLPIWETAVFVMGLHAGMHLEAREWDRVTR